MIHKKNEPFSYSKDILSILEIRPVFRNCLGGVTRYMFFKVEIIYFLKRKNNKKKYWKGFLVNGHRDLDNISKKFIDELCRTVGIDDCQIVDLHLKKKFGCQDKIRIKIQILA